MRAAVRLGRKGIGRTSPNPPVGAVVVKAGRIIGSGFHPRAGEPHAEVEALREAGARARGGTLYVTLEPCTHYGRTPPCAPAVLAAGVRRVVVGTRDPNPRVRGGGIQWLRRHGVDVAVDVEGAACAELIAPFTKHVRTGLPLLTLKLAASLDGRIATAAGHSHWISSEPSRRLVHRLRNEADAVMVGAGTVLADDPLLTCRMRGGRDPLRVIVDGRLRIPLRARVLAGDAAAGTLIATAARNHRKLGMLRERGATVLAMGGSGERLSLRALLRALGDRGILSVLLEGGGSLAGAALREGVVDRVVFFYAPKLIGGDGLPMIGPLGIGRLDRARQLRQVKVSRVGEDIMIRAMLEN